VPYPRKLLGDTEQVILDFHPHWVALVKPIGWTVLWVVGLLAGLFFIDSYRLYVFLGAIVAWAVTAGMGFLRWRTTEYVLTTERLITRQGIVSKSGREIPLERVNDISFRQTVLERLVGSGDLVVESAGEQGQEPFVNIPRPSLVQNEIYRQMEENQTRHARGGPVTASIPQQIEELARLRDRGIISGDEFEAKKADLLRRM